MMFRRHLLLGLACASLGLGACSSSVSVPSADEAPVVPEQPGDAPTPDPEIGAPPSLGEPTVFNATMTGREQVPTLYATDATGTGTFSLDADGTTLGYTVEHTLEAPTAAHLHLGIAGESGEVLLPLTVAAGEITGTVTVTPEQARAIEDGRVYVDIHSAGHPDGEIRGQVVLPGELVYVARLSADQENPPTESASGGIGEFLVDGTTNQMRYIVQVQGMAGVPTMAVIGMGPAGVNGPMAIDLAEPKTLPSAAFSGDRTITSSEDLDLGRWYVNVHSRRFPMGEIRGQILRPGQELYLARMTGAESVPAVATGARGSVALIVDSNRDRVIYDVALSEMTATAAYLAEGPVGANGTPTMPFQVLGSSFRSMRMLTADATLLGSLAGGNVYASASSARFPGGEIRGQMRPVAVRR